MRNQIVRLQMAVQLEAIGTQLLKNTVNGSGEYKGDIGTADANWKRNHHFDN
jgi:hypothetical protein